MNYLKNPTAKQIEKGMNWEFCAYGILPDNLETNFTMCEEFTDWASKPRYKIARQRFYKNFKRRRARFQMYATPMLWTEFPNTCKGDEIAKQLLFGRDVKG